MLIFDRYYRSRFFCNKHFIFITRVNFLTVRNLIASSTAQIFPFFIHLLLLCRSTLLHSFFIFFLIPFSQGAPLFLRNSFDLLVLLFVHKSYLFMQDNKRTGLILHLVIAHVLFLIESTSLGRGVIYNHMVVWCPRIPLLLRGYGMALDLALSVIDTIDRWDPIL